MISGKRLSVACACAALACAVTVASGQEPAGQRRVTPVSLGGSLTDQHGENVYGIYVPTRYGGTLTIKVSAGEVRDLTGPDGKAEENGSDLGFDKQGWHTFRVLGADKPYEVSTTFVQIGQAARMPWNFYYWPTKSDCIHEPWSGGNGRVDTVQVFGDDILVATPGGYIAPGEDIVRAGPNGILETPVAAGDDSTWFPNLYDDLTFRDARGTTYETPAPLLKFDQLFNTSARSWEAANSQNQDINRWPGHCLGGAVASIMLAEPKPAPGSGINVDELKALWSELGENHYNHKIGQHVTDVPAGPPQPGADPCDAHVGRMHALLEEFLRGRRKALLSNMRAFPPRGTPNEVWNHGLGKYTATYQAVQGRGERSVRIKMETVANTGSSLNGHDDKLRVNTYEYIVVYGLDGKVDLSNPWACDWIAVGGEAMFAPLNVMEVLESRWQGHNPYVTESNVRSIDLANSGGVAPRFAAGSTAPSFRPVATYEAGRAPAFAPGFNNGINGNNFFNSNTISNVPGTPYTPSPRSGDLFGIFRRISRANDSQGASN